MQELHKVLQMVQYHKAKAPRLVGRSILLHQHQVGTRDTQWSYRNNKKLVPRRQNTVVPREMPGIELKKNMSTPTSQFPLTSFQ
eukprot:UN16759